jgi:hypothetical protein
MNTALNFLGVNVPFNWVLDWYDNGLTVNQIIQEKNIEIRRIMILWYGLEKFLSDGGGRVVKEPEEGDYPWACIYSIEAPERTHYYLMLINQTIVPNAEKLTDKEKQDQGLTFDGRKKYFLECRDPKHYKTMYDAVGESFGFGPGEYKPDVEA